MDMTTQAKLLSPEGMYPFAGKMIKPFLAAALIFVLCGLYTGFFVAPVDATQGNSYRILYAHVPAAWMGMMLYVIMAVFCAVGSATGNRIWPMIASSIAPTGAMMTFLALWCGALWGRPTWGAYWVWDARLTSALILLFFYLGFIALENAISDWRRSDKACAVIGIVGLINVPIVYFSVNWWNTLHQGASLTSQGSSIHPMMLTAMLLMVVGFCLYSVAASFARLRSIILEREMGEEWTQNMAIKGEI